MKLGTAKFLVKRKRKDSFEIQNIIPVNSSNPRKEIADDAELPPAYLRPLVSIATNAWRAKTKMADPLTGEIREEMKRVCRHIETIYRNLAEVGIVIRDHTREAYDEGQPMRVVASKPTAGLDEKRVSETLLPSIFWNDRLIQNGEIEIAIPIAPKTSAETQTA